MFIFVLVLVALEKSQRGKTSAQAIASDARFKRIPLSGPKAWLAFLACFLPVTLGFVVPFSVLSYYAVSVGDPLLGKRFLDFMLNSVQLSSVATMVTTLAALLLAYLTAVSGFDRQLAEFFEQRFGWRSGLLLTGTTFILIYAYLVRFLTVAFNTTNSGFKHIPPVYDHVAQCLWIPCANCRPRCCCGRLISRRWRRVFIDLPVTSALPKPPQPQSRLSLSA